MNPTTDRDGQSEPQVTRVHHFQGYGAIHLREPVPTWPPNSGLNIAMVSGDETHTTDRTATTFNAILTNFAPVARNRSVSDGAMPDS